MVRHETTFTANRRPARSPGRLRHGRHLLLVLAGLALSVQASEGPSRAEAGEAIRLVRETTTRLLAAVDRDRGIIEKNPQRAYRLVEQYVVPHVDMQRISRLVLGRHWRKATVPQRTRFVEAFQGLLVRTYATAVTEYTHSTINYLAPRLHDNRMEVTVKTEVPQPSGPAAAVDYRMRRSGEQWKVVDMVIEGISLVATFRNAFGVQIREDGLDTLIGDIVRKNRDI